MSVNTKIDGSKNFLLLLVVLAAFLMIAGAGITSRAYAVAFQQTDEDIRNDHYNFCKDRLGPGLTRAAADQLDANCREIPKPKITPEQQEMDRQRMEQQRIEH